MNKETQLKFVKDTLNNGHTITSMDAFQHGITRLSAIIHKLRHDHGMPIKANMIPIQSDYYRSRFAEYFLDQLILKGVAIDYSNRQAELAKFLKQQYINMEIASGTIRLSVINLPSVSVDMTNIDLLPDKIKYLKSRMDELCYEEHIKKHGSF